MSHRPRLPPGYILTTSKLGVVPGPNPISNNPGSKKRLMPPAMVKALNRRARQHRLLSNNGKAMGGSHIKVLLKKAPAEEVLSAFSLKKVMERNAAIDLVKKHSLGAKHLMRLGLSAKMLKEKYGLTCKELWSQLGFSAKEIGKAGFTCIEFMDAGARSSTLVSAGFTPKELWKAGCSFRRMENVGFSLPNLLKYFKPTELLKEYTREELLMKASRGRLFPAGK